jgi:formate hydrogenlyase subunit 3/multisubunit Na+/H+ antiporter MnhD subunit
VHDHPDPDAVIRIRARRLGALASGLVAGLLGGLGLFVATMWLVLKGGHPVGPHLALLGQFFIGYTVTPLGSLVGLAYGFLAGFVVFYCGAALYNWIADRRDHSREGGP